MFLLLVELQAKPGLGPALQALLTSLVDAARGEPGTLVYALHKPEGADGAPPPEGRFILYELYQDRAAWQAHLRVPFVVKALQRFDALLDGPPRLTPCETVAGSWRAP